MVARQLGRPPRAFRRVVVRCPHGRPAVAEQAPYDDCGEPFPTTYWLTCLHAVAAVARLEAAGGVERWTAVASSDEALRASVAAAHDEQRRLRHQLAAGEAGVDSGASLELGVGGAAGGGSLKCLHAHVAWALARPPYRLGDAVLAELEPLWPERCCTPDVRP